MIASSSFGSVHARPAAGSRRIAPRVSSAAATRRSSSTLLERPPPEIEAADVLVPPANYADLLPSIDDSTGFQEYESAAARMVGLERLSAELLENLKELNSASEALDSTPPPEFFQLQHQEARRAKRAAAREARKAQAAAAAQPTPLLDPVVAPHHTKAPEKLKEIAAAHDATTSSEAGKVLGSPPRTSSLPKPVVASLTSKPSLSAGYERQGQTHQLAAGPSLMSGPSLVAHARKAVGKDARAEPSVWAREANARRAGTSRTRRTAAAVQEASTSMAAADSSGGSTDGTTVFMKRSASHDLLDGASEKALAAIVKDALFVERVTGELQAVLKRQPTTAECARALGMDSSAFAERLSAGQRAKSVMLQANYRLVIAVCKKYQHRGMALQDLITEGVRGLLTGVEKFDADKGFRFSTYAHWWIRQAVTRAISTQGREVRLPAHVAELLSRIRSAQAQLSEELSREASVEEVSALVQLTPKRINEILSMAWNAGSLDSLVGSEESGGTMKDRLQDERLTPEESLQQVMFGREMDVVLSGLSEREADVIRLRFGLDGEQVVTLEEIGARWQLTRERVRQIESNALRELKQKGATLSGILQEHAVAQVEAELTARSSQGTNKSK